MADRAGREGQDRVSRLGSINDDRTADDCAAYTGSGAACFEGDLSELDDDFVIVSLAPRACATCGYGEDAPSGRRTHWLDCITCADAGDEFMVSSTTARAPLARRPRPARRRSKRMGFADLDDSACEAIRACYDDDDGICRYPSRSAHERKLHRRRRWRRRQRRACISALS